MVARTRENHVEKNKTNYVLAGRAVKFERQRQDEDEENAEAVTFK